MFPLATTKRHFEQSELQFSDGCCSNITGQEACTVRACDTTKGLPHGAGGNPQKVESKREISHDRQPKALDRNGVWPAASGQKLKKAA
jgi:hypothetical protein